MAKKTSKKKKKADFEPRIVVFACNWCSYPAADNAGLARMQYPSNIRIVRVMCGGRLSAGDSTCSSPARALPGSAVPITENAATRTTAHKRARCHTATILSIVSRSTKSVPVAEGRSRGCHGHARVAMRLSLSAFRDMPTTSVGMAPVLPSRSSFVAIIAARELRNKPLRFGAAPAAKSRSPGEDVAGPTPEPAAKANA